MPEVVSRVFYGIIMLASLYRSIYSYSFYITFMSTVFILSIKEMFPYLKFRIIKQLILIQSIVIYLVYFELEKDDVLSIIIYNATSDAIQYIIGKIFGKIKPFTITNKSIEGYIAGLILTPYIYNFGNVYILLNLVGMMGGLISSFIKRKIGLKHWGNSLGSHGGFNDRIDSLSLAIITFYVFKK